MNPRTVATYRDGFVPFLDFATSTRCTPSNRPSAYQ
jgi:hypothetical protein